MVHLDGSTLSLEQLESIARGDARVALADSARARVRAARALVDRFAAGDAAVYGVNTGFGSLAEVKIPHDQLSALQLNLIRSHAAGVGEPLPVDAVRALMTLRANVLAKGFSGIRESTLDALIALVNDRVHPRVPSRGSVGASGDLAPLAHLALVLVGEGELLDGTRPAPLTLAAKEGLALINGTQASAAVLALAVLDARRLARAADLACAMSVDALRGSYHPFEPRIHAARPVPGQADAAANLLALLTGSGINQSHANCGKVQDAYALRCAPQVHGSTREAIAFAERLARIEANSATDNPMVFADDPDASIVSGGNFHGAPVALAADTLTIGLAQLATISERRTDRMMTAVESGLPPFLIRNSGLNSGLMMAHVTAAALCAEIKTLAHPAAVDTIPTSAGREDHVSMSMGAALKAARVVTLARAVLSIEIVAAAQAIDLLAPLATSPALAAVHGVVRAVVPTLDTDRPPSPDIEAVASLIERGALERACPLALR